MTTCRDNPDLDGTLETGKPSTGGPAQRWRLRSFVARVGVGALLFFTIKGLIWLAIGGGVAAWATR